MPAGASRDELVLNNDLAPTFAHLAGAESPNFVDGRSLVPLLRGKASSWRTAALVEQRGLGKIGIPAYGMLRTEGEAYVEYENGERELYDLDKDPHQLENLAGQRPGEEATLSARLRELRNCSGSSCRAAEDSTAP